MRCNALLICLLLTPSVTQAAEWPQWRGPFFNGSTDEENLPSRWSKTENVAWSVEMPGASAATPIVWKDRVFVSSVDAERGEVLEKLVGGPGHGGAQGSEDRGLR